MKQGEGVVEYDAEAGPRGKTLEFFGLDDAETQEIKSEIARHDGLVRMFVHPDYPGYAKIEEKKNQEMAERLLQMDAAFHRILESSDEKTPPIIIIHGVHGFQLGDTLHYDVKQDKWMDSYEKALTILEKRSDWLEKASDLYRPRCTILLIPAKETSPTPLLAYAYSGDEAWDALVEGMKELGVKKILMGGAELYAPRSTGAEGTETSSDDILRHVSGCLGTTIRHMRENFEIELSSLTYPEGRKEITPGTSL